MLELSDHDLIEAVFGSDPRTGKEAHGFWWSKRSGDKEFFNAVRAKGKSVCLDGPTGSGKTSLAMRGLQDHGFRFARIVIAPMMTWRELCREVVTVPKKRDNSVSIKLSLGIKHFVPSGNVDAQIDESMTPLSELDYADKYIEGFSHYDMARLLDRQRTTLLLDDFENAAEDLVGRVASLAKLLAAPDYRREAKVVITATDNAFTRLLGKQHTLRGRLEPIHLGGLPDKSDPWGFLTAGLDALQILHPGSSRIQNQISQQKKCRDAVYDATAGILKDITALGTTLANLGFERRSITAREVIHVCDTISKSNVGEHSLQFMLPLRCIVEDPIVHDVLEHLHSQGISRVHYIHDIKSALGEKCTPEQIYSAIDALVKHGILVQTGLHSGVLFPRDAALLHALCLAASDPEKYKAPKEFYKKDQLVLQLFDRP